MRKGIFDEMNRTIGYIENLDGVFTKIYDSMGRTLGMHNSMSDMVTDKMGKTIGKGIELLGTLLKK